MLGKTRELATELLRAVLPKAAIPRMDGGDDLVDAHGLGNGDQADVCRVAPGTLRSLLDALQNSLSATRYLIRI